MRKVFVSFALNDWPGSANDLNGCINDQTDYVEVFKILSFEIFAYQNSEVTKELVITVLRKIIFELVPGDILIIHYSGHGTKVLCIHNDESDGYDEAWYVYDGTVIDDTLADIFSQLKDNIHCFMISDSCFSESMARDINIKARFKASMEVLDENGNKKPLKVRKRMLKSVDKVGTLSGCMADQTSSDGYFNGRANGALSYYSLKTLEFGITYREWYKRIRNKLPSGIYTQIPQLEGPDWILDQPVFGSIKTKKECWFKKLFKNW